MHKISDFTDKIKYIYENPESFLCSARLYVLGHEIEAFFSREENSFYIDNFEIINLISPETFYFKFLNNLVVFENRFIFIKLKNNFAKLDDIILNLESGSGYYLKEIKYQNGNYSAEIIKEDLNIHFCGKILEGYIKNNSYYLKYKDLKKFLYLMGSSSRFENINILENRLILKSKLNRVITLPQFDTLNIEQLLFEAMAGVEYKIGVKWRSNIIITKKSCIIYPLEKNDNNIYKDFGKTISEKPAEDFVKTIVYLNGKQINADFSYVNGKVEILKRSLCSRFFLRNFKYLDDAISYHNAWDYISNYFDNAENIYYVIINNKMSKAPLKLIRKGSRVDIYVNFNFCGKCSEIEFEDKHELYKQVAINGILDSWQGRYFENPGYDLFGMDYVDVIIHIDEKKDMKKLNFHINHEGRGFAPYNIFWNIRGNIFNSVYCFQFQKNVYYTYNRFAQLAAHEFGHLIGLGDAYKDITQDAAPVNPETPQLNIMRDCSNIVSSNDIEMVLEAFKTNKLQRYTDYYFLFKKSKVIRYNNSQEN